MAKRTRFLKLLELLTALMLALVLLLAARWCLLGWTGFDIISAKHYRLLWDAYQRGFVFDSAAKLALLLWPLPFGLMLWVVAGGIVPLQVLMVQGLFKLAGRVRKSGQSDIIQHGLPHESEPDRGTSVDPAAKDFESEYSAIISRMKALLPEEVRAALEVPIVNPPGAAAAESQPGDTNSGSAAAMATAGRSPASQSPPGGFKPLTLQDMQDLLAFMPDDDRAAIEAELARAGLGGDVVSEVLGAALASASGAVAAGRPLPSEAAGPARAGEFKPVPGLRVKMKLDMFVDDDKVQALILAGWMNQGHGLIVQVIAFSDPGARLHQLAIVIDELANGINAVLEAELPPGPGYNVDAIILCPTASAELAEEAQASVQTGHMVHVRPVEEYSTFVATAYYSGFASELPAEIAAAVEAAVRELEG